MPISAKISNEIKQLDVDPAFKEMMTSILMREDEGLTQKTYKAEYKAIVDAYIGHGESKDGSGAN